MEALRGGLYTSLWDVLIFSVVCNSPSVTAYFLKASEDRKRERERELVDDVMVYNY